MKKLLSVFLTFCILLSCIAVSGIAATAAEEQAQLVYLKYPKDNLSTSFPLVRKSKSGTYRLYACCWPVYGNTLDFNMDESGYYKRLTCKLESEDDDYLTFSADISQAGVVEENADYMLIFYTQATTWNLTMTKDCLGDTVVMTGDSVMNSDEETVYFVSWQNDPQCGMAAQLISNNTIWCADKGCDMLPVYRPKAAFISDALSTKLITSYKNDGVDKVNLNTYFADAEQNLAHCAKYDIKPIDVYKQYASDNAQALAFGVTKTMTLSGREVPVVVYNGKYYAALSYIAEVLGMSDPQIVSKEKQRLETMNRCLYEETSSLGDLPPYMYNMYSEYVKSKQVLDDSTSTDEDYTKAYADILKEKYSGLIQPKIAIASVEQAEKEKNYNNWYSDEEWDLYQTKIKKLREAVGNYSSTANHQYSLDEMKVITEAFHEWLYTLNSMTNKDYVKGDVDGNGVVNINDATTVQKALASMCNLTTAQKMRARSVLYNRAVNSSDSMGRYIITINDVTQIQRYLSGNKVESDKIYNLPNTDGRKICIYVDELDSLEDEDYLMSHFFNYFVCPRKTNDYPALFPNNYYLGYDYQWVYRYCKDTIGIEYKV